MQEVLLRLLRFSQCVVEFAWFPIIGSPGRCEKKEEKGKRENCAWQRRGRKRETVTAPGSGSRRPRRNVRYSWKTIYYTGDLSQWNFLSGILLLVWIISVPFFASINCICAICDFSYRIVFGYLSLKRLWNQSGKFIIDINVI